MKHWNLDPKNINQPIQLLGASLIGAVFLVGEFLFASTKCPYPIMAGFFGATAILIFPMILLFIYTLQTKHRDKLQTDYYYFQSRKQLYEEQSKKPINISLEEIKKWLK
jgi:hypothetical protein